ncbi:MAG: PAS domain S-box protein, partial [Segetibacter sp.]
MEDIKLDFQKTADQILLQEYTPAGVVINEQLDIVHFHGDTGAYLMPSPGKPNLNLIKMAREGLGFELRSVIHKATTTNGPATKEGVPMQSNGVDRLVNIKVIPLPKSIDPFYLVLFQETVVLEAKKPRQVTGKEKNDAKDMRIQQLERELARAREDMGAITEEQEAFNEELQSANEELLSGSEELQSLNEELETTKEELQSGNEELTIVNQELFERNEIITDARKYSDAIIAAIHEPLLVPNKDLHIRTANNSFYTTFGVTEKDTEGKLLFELGNNQWDIPSLRNLLQNILPGKKEVYDYEVTHEFPVIGERSMLLNAWEIHRESDKEKLILLAIGDITERKKAEQQLIESETHSDKERMVLYNSFMSAPAGIAILKGPTHIYEFANTDYEKLVGKKITLGKTVKEYFPELEEQGILQLLDNVFLTGEPFVSNELPIELDLEGEGILHKFFLNLVLQPMKDKNGKTERILAHIIDFTAQVTARKQIEASEKRFSNILSQSLLAIAILKGTEMVIASANDAIIELWGKGKNVIGKPLLEVLPEIKDQPFPKILDDVYTTGVPFTSPEIKAILVRNGKPEECYFNLIYQPYTEADNTITGVTILATEITEQVLARKLLLGSGERYRFLADAVPEKVWTTDEHGVVNYFNQQWMYYTGLSFEELNDWSWEKIIHADDLEAHQNLWKHSINTGEDFQLEHRFLRHDGEYRWHLSRSLAQKNEKGETVMWIGTITDIHEQKSLAEEKILLEFAEDFASYKTGEEFFSSLATYLAKKTGMDYVFIGELTEKEKNHSNINTIALSAYGKIVPNIEYPLLDGPCEKIISGTVYSYPQNCMMTFPKNGTIAQFNVQGCVGYPLTDMDGVAIGLVAVMHEKEILNHEYVSALLKIIARRAEFEMERIKFSKILSANNQQLEISNRNLAQYAYVASHDLQEPLRKIIIFARLVTDRSNDTLNEDSKNYLEKITLSALRMRELIHDLLA